MSKDAATHVITGNLDDDLDKVADADWIIEAIVENLDIKRALYRRLDEVRKPGSVVSSNTSTIPLGLLIEGQSESMQADFLITHFFNPPRHMRLLELVSGDSTRSDALESVREFSDVRLGKSIVDCKDTPGFIANRIGIFWLQKGLLSAIEHGVSVEEADALMSRPVGIPKTGIFGLWDLVGIDLGPHLIDSMTATLGEKDAFLKLARTPQIVTDMIQNGYTGRKGKGGFYRMNRSEGNKTLESLDLSSGEYRATMPPQLQSLNAAGNGLRELLVHDDRGGAYMRDVLYSVLGYCASLVPEICDDILSVDQAMKLGYNWRHGPFELIDKIGAGWFAEQLQQAGLDIPPILGQLGDRRFYRVEDGRRQQFYTDGSYHEIRQSDGVLLLSDIKRTAKPIDKGESASLWDIGENVACLEFHTKMNAVDRGVLDMIQRALDIVGKHYRALVIYNEGRAFSVGADLANLKKMVDAEQWDEINAFVESGQRIYTALQQAPFPVVGAPAGMALGGGCEVLLHCHAIQAHAETYIGLVEAGVGLIPAWGGCKELLKRCNKARGNEKGMMDAFAQIARARMSGSAAQARQMGFFTSEDRISMNRDRLLCDARDFALELAADFAPVTPEPIHRNGAKGRQQLLAKIAELADAAKASDYDQLIGREIVDVLTGESDAELAEGELFKAELEAFKRLLRHQETQDRIVHMLKTGKPLRN